MRAWEFIRPALPVGHGDAEPTGGTQEHPGFRRLHRRGGREAGAKPPAVVGDSKAVRATSADERHWQR